MAYALGQFRATAEFGFDHCELDGRDEHTHSQFDQFAKSSFPADVHQQWLLSARNAVKSHRRSRRKEKLISK